MKKYLTSDKFTKPLFYIIIALCFSPVISAPVALLLGFIISFLKISPSGFDTSKVTKYLLQASIVLMGFGMNLTQVLKISETGFGITVVSVTSTLAAGMLLGYFLKVDRKTALLISSGTAICGGSAIAAVSPVINAKSYQMSFALAVVFVLNAVALFLFPYIGHHLHLSQNAFGYWAAIAIHDTSSVVGAGSAFGPKALQVATSVKLTRALWIIPLSISLAFFNKTTDGSKIKIPWFIGLFVIALVASHFITGWADTYKHLSWLGKKGLFVALFLIGTSLSFSEIKKAGYKSFLLGFLLWIIISTLSLTYIIS
jgi:uncharacterized integral membrane protein (TIGR00698 family)